MDKEEKPDRKAKSQLPALIIRALWKLGLISLFVILLIAGVIITTHLSCSMNTEELIAATKSGGVDDVCAAADKLGNMEPTDEIILALTEVIKKYDTRYDDAKYFSLQSLAKFGSRAKKAQTTIIEIEPSSPLWAHASRTLRKINADSVLVVPVLSKVITSGDSLSRGESAWVLGEYGPEAAAAVYVLNKQLVYEDDPQALYRVIWALGKIGKASKKALPRLSKLLEENGKFEFPAAIAIANIVGVEIPSAEEAVIFMREWYKKKKEEK